VGSVRKAWRKKPTIVQTLSFSGGKQEESSDDSDSDSDSDGDSSIGWQRTRRKKRKTNKRKRNKGTRNKGKRNKGKRNKGYPNKGKDDVVAIVNADLAKQLPARITQMLGSVSETVTSPLMTSYSRRASATQGAQARGLTQRMGRTGTPARWCTSDAVQVHRSRRYTGCEQIYSAGTVTSRQIFTSCQLRRLRPHPRQPR
jgi:hypothetical protein